MLELISASTYYRHPAPGAILLDNGQPTHFMSFREAGEALQARHAAHVRRYLGSLSPEDREKLLQHIQEIYPPIVVTGRYYDRYVLPIITQLNEKQK